MSDHDAWEMDQDSAYENVHARANRIRTFQIKRADRERAETLAQGVAAMADYKTEFENLATAAQETHEAYVAYRHRDPARLAEKMGALGCALDRQPAPSRKPLPEPPDPRPYQPDSTAHEVSVPPPRTATQVLADAPAAATVELPPVAPDPVAAEREHCEHVATEHDQEMHDYRTGKRNDCLTLTGRLIRERADAREQGRKLAENSIDAYTCANAAKRAAEREHCKDAALDIHGDIFTLETAREQVAMLASEIEKERADAAKRATEATEERMRDEVHEAIVTNQRVISDLCEEAAQRAIEAERQRALAWIAKHSSGGLGEKKIIAGIESGEKP